MLYTIILVDTSYFHVYHINAYRIYNMESESWCKLWTLGGDVSVYQPRHYGVGCWQSRDVVPVLSQEVFGKSLHILISFVRI